MVKIDFVANATACKQFSANCATIKEKITVLKLRNDRLSNMLDVVIQNHNYSINRIKAHLDV